MTLIDERPGDPGRGPTLADARPLRPTDARRPVVERCDGCDAPVDANQRYCVVCGAHQRRADDPAARWIAEARRPRPAVGTAAAVAVPARGLGAISPLTAAVVIALVPIAAGIGVLVGRDAGISGDQAVELVKAARGSGPATTTAVSNDAGDATASDAVGDEDDGQKAADDGPKVDGIETSTKQAPVLAGGAHKLEGQKPTKKDIEDGRKAVEEINSRKGQAYIDTQKNLPDTIVVP